MGHIYPVGAPSHEVFLSVKQTAEGGLRTRDSDLAEALERTLGERGISTFRADSALQTLGRADYSRAIAEALEQAAILVVVATDPGHVASEWVRFEWSTFLNEIRSHRKLGSALTVLDGVKIDALPIELRQWQSFDVSSGDWARVCDFIENALVGLRSRRTLDQSERLLETGGQALQLVDRIGRVLAESRLTELEVTRWGPGRGFPAEFQQRIDDHIAKLRELLAGGQVDAGDPKRSGRP